MMIDLDEFVAEFHNFLLTEKRVSHNTFSAYRQDLNQLVQFFNQERLTLKKSQSSISQEVFKKT